ncbi:hypothetical protein SprV_0702343200 [Sparganum proliferum]
MKFLFVLLSVCVLYRGSLACTAKETTTEPPENQMPILPLDAGAGDDRCSKCRPMPGGKRPLTPEEITHPDFRSIVNKSLIDLRNKSKGCMDYELVDIKAASKQIVAGMKYEWKMTVRPKRLQTRADCPVSDCDEAGVGCNRHHQYKSSAWVRPWLKNEESHQFTHARISA